MDLEESDTDNYIARSFRSRVDMAFIVDGSFSSTEAVLAPSYARVLILVSDDVSFIQVKFEKCISKE